MPKPANRGDTPDRSLRSRIWLWTLMGGLPLTSLWVLIAWLGAHQNAPYMPFLGIFSVIAFLVSYFAVIGCAAALAHRLNRTDGWIALAIGLPYAAPQVLTFLPALPERSSFRDSFRDRPFWHVIALGASLLVAQVAIGIMWDNLLQGTIIFGMAVVLFAVPTGYDLYHGGPLSRTGLAGIALLAAGLFYGLFNSPPKGGDDWIAWIIFWVIVAATAAVMMRREARRRCVSSWRRWQWLSFAAPFITPLVFAFVREPRFAGKPVRLLLDEFDNLFHELSEAEIKRRASAGLSLSGVGIAEVAANAARNTVMLRHSLAPEEAQRLVELYASVSSQEQASRGKAGQGLRGVTDCYRCRCTIGDGSLRDTVSSLGSGSVATMAYECKSCGRKYCLDCMAALKKRGVLCDACGGKLGW